MDNLFVGRQAILDKHLNLHAYELLFRNGETNSAEFDDSDLASTRLMVSAFLEIGLEQIVGSNRAFINLSKGFLVGDQPLPMSNEQVVLEILEDIQMDSPALEGINRLVSQGYKLALDDFRYTPEYDPVLDQADYVKLDILNLTREEIRDEVRLARKYPVKLIAEKIETEEHLQLSRELGFDYFQGYYFSRPHVVTGKAMPSNHLVVLSLMSQLEDPNTDIKDLEALIIQDASLSYRLLRYINSASFALRREIDSIQQAIIMVGSRTIRNWANMLLLTQIGSDKPQELMIIAMMRARMCSELAKQIPDCNQEQAFTVGLFSCLDALLDRPMAELLDHLPLTGEIKLALLDGEGLLGQLSDSVIKYEQGNWGSLDLPAEQVHIFFQAWLEAVTWADTNNKSLTQATSTLSM